MMPPADTRDRVIRLEAEVSRLHEDQQKMSRKVDEMHEVLIAAKGAKWAILGVASLAGFIAAKLSFFLPWLSK